MTGKARSRWPGMAGLCIALMAAGCVTAELTPVGPTASAFPAPAPGVFAGPGQGPFPGPAPAPTQSYIYPDRGQTPQQQEFDRGQCYSWAVQQTGFDPANPRVAAAPPPFPGAPQGGAFQGAAGGAALGAVGGAIGGSVGEGAAIGAAVGGLFGMMRRARWAEEQQQQQMRYQAQQQSALAQGQSNYHRAFGACMAARGYTVR